MVGAQTGTRSMRRGEHNVPSRVGRDLAHGSSIDRRSTGRERRRPRRLDDRFATPLANLRGGTRQYGTTPDNTACSISPAQTTQIGIRQHKPDGPTRPLKVAARVRIPLGLPRKHQVRATLPVSRRVAPLVFWTCCQRRAEVLIGGCDERVSSDAEVTPGSSVSTWAPTPSRTSSTTRHELCVRKARSTAGAQRDYQRS